MAVAVAPNHSPPRSNHPNPELQSTPQSRGSATVSDNIGSVGLQVPNVYPWITRDVEKFTECSVDTMLKAFLEDCVDNKSASWNMDSLFNKSLDAMVRISNGDFQHKDLQVKASYIKDYLKAYAQNSKMGEEALYPHFVHAVNTALLCLQLVEVQEIRPGASSPICFHVNDPSYLTQEHQGQLSQRKPDVVVVSEMDAQNALREDYKGTLPQFDIFLQAAIKPPGAVLERMNSKEKRFNEKCSSDKKSFQWRNVRTFVEFKTYKRKMEAPPQSYTSQAFQPHPKHQYLTAHGLREEPDAPRSETLSVPPASSIRRSPRNHLEIPAPGTAQSGAKSLKRSSEGAESEAKRQKTDSKRRDRVIVQAGGYAAEMFAAHSGRQHAVGLIVVDDLLYVWRYDRQGAIQCSALNFIQDLPRFLLLLLAMQRFQNHNWGLNPDIDPEFDVNPKPPAMTFHDDLNQKIEIKLELSSEERKTHYGLNGRATNVFPAMSTTYSSEDGLIAKVFWAEESRVSEPDILKEVYQIAQENDDVKGHVPELVCYKVYEGTSTKLIRDRLGINAVGSRVLYVIIFRKLKPITELDGDDFLRAWWETVKCHFALWKNNVRHRDISPSNLMYRMVNGKPIGVLNDFDLATLGDGVTGTERTGTVPFMALRLLLKPALAGQVKHMYEHDAESFIWVLNWVTLCYDNGKLSRGRNPAVDGWVTLDARTCLNERTSYLHHKQWEDCRWGEDHARNFQVVNACFRALNRFHVSEEESTVDDVVFENLLKGPVELFLPPQN